MFVMKVHYKACVKHFMMNKKVSRKWNNVEFWWNSQRNEGMDDDLPEAMKLMDIKMKNKVIK